MTSIEKRNIKIITALTLPGGSLRKIGASWGISSSRVDQIFKNYVGASHSDIKKRIIMVSHITCFFCGKYLKPIRVIRNGKFCNKKCYYKYYRFELVPRKCAVCSRLYFRHRNWSQSKNSSGKYCSMLCYRADVIK